MSVRAKFKVESKEPGVSGGGFTITARPVIGGSTENDSFYKWTPSGQLTLSTINETAAAQLEVGQEFYLDITPIQSAKEEAGALPDPEPEAAAEAPVAPADESPAIPPET